MILTFIAKMENPLPDLVQNERVGPPVGGEVGGEEAHSATATSPSPEIRESRSKVSGDEGCRREAETSSPNGRGRLGDGARGELND
jgi:hypothetical protein